MSAFVTLSLTSSNFSAFYRLVLNEGVNACALDTTSETTGFVVVCRVSICKKLEEAIISGPVLASDSGHGHEYRYRK